jgi:hypothetical protein
VAGQTYELFFGTANAGGAPTFVRFSRSDTHAALTAPAITEIGDGLYAFTVDWAAMPAASIEYVATLNGSDLGDVISSAPSPGQITAIVPAATNLDGYPTAKTVVNRAAIQIGKGAVADPFAATDADFVLLCDLLSSLGDDLLNSHQWTHLVLPFSFTTDGSTTSYALPIGFQEMIDQTLWNRSTRLPGIGPLSFQQSTALQARLVNVVLNVVFQIQGNMLTMPIVPPSGAAVNGMYLTRFWVKSAAASVPDKAKATAQDDVLLLDEELLIAGLKLRFEEVRGFETARSQQRYEAKLEAVVGKNLGAQVLSLGGSGRNTFDRMLDGRNVPEGNW